MSGIAIVSILSLVAISSVAVFWGSLFILSKKADNKIRPWI